MRDSQRQKCYDAEVAAEGRLVRTPSDGSRVDPVITDWFRRMDKAECQEFINAVVLKLDIVVKAVKFVEERKHAIWCSGPKTVILPPWARTKDVVIHELAHALTYQQMPSLIPGHGAEWVENRIMMTSLFGTDEIAAAFRKAYLEQSARVIPSPEQAIAFLNMARRKEYPSERRIRVVCADGTKVAGRLVEWDGQTLTVGKRPGVDNFVVIGEETVVEDLAGEKSIILLIADVSELRYATFIDPELR